MWLVNGGIYLFIKYMQCRIIQWALWAQPQKPMGPKQGEDVFVFTLSALKI